MKIKIHYFCLALLLLDATASRADVPPNNIWNNPNLRSRRQSRPAHRHPHRLESRRQQRRHLPGVHRQIRQRDSFAGGQRHRRAGYGEWYSDQPLPCLASEGHLLNLQWFELFDITGGDMRVTCCSSTPRRPWSASGITWSTGKVRAGPALWRRRRSCAKRAARDSARRQDDARFARFGRRIECHRHHAGG